MRTPLDQTIIGRARELAVIDDWLERAALGAGTLVVEAEAGMGKTTLWQAAVDRAEAAGRRTFVARPADAEATFAYAAVGDLLDGGR